ncbi:MAG: hypothetical protein IKJ07_01535 [Clostridia bacterium]|nr:hypothetical protein [Clostridia bacterium]
MKKITFITYLSVISITAICAMIFKERLNIVIDSLIPVGAIIVQFICGLLIKCDIYYSHGGRLFRLDDTDFKYSKNERGEGKFVESAPARPAPSKKTKDIMGYSLMLCAAFYIPFIFFFSVGAKWCSLTIFVVASIVGGLLNILHVIKKFKAEIEDERIRSEARRRELEEQKKREELGKWK